MVDGAVLVYRTWLNAWHLNISKKFAANKQPFQSVSTDHSLFKRGSSNQLWISNFWRSNFNFYKIFQITWEMMKFYLLRCGLFTWRLRFIWCSVALLGSLGMINGSCFGCQRTEDDRYFFQRSQVTFLFVRLSWNGAVAIAVPVHYERIYRFKLGQSLPEWRWNVGPFEKWRWLYRANNQQSCSHWACQYPDRICNFCPRNPELTLIRLTLLLTFSRAQSTEPGWPARQTDPKADRSDRWRLTGLTTAGSAGVPWREGDNTLFARSPIHQFQNFFSTPQSGLTLKSTLSTRRRNVLIKFLVEFQNWQLKSIPSLESCSWSFGKKLAAPPESSRHLDSIIQEF